MSTGVFGVGDLDLREATDDQLDLMLAEAQAAVDRCRTLQMAVIVEKDRRQVHTAEGYRTLGEWVAARLDETPETARALVNTAKAIPGEVVEALVAGEMGFARAVETTRLGQAGVEDPLGVSWRYDIAGLRRRVFSQHPITTDDERDVFDRRHLVLQPNLDESSWRLFGLLPGYEGTVVAKALDTRSDSFPTNGSSVAQRRVDALVSISTDSLTTTRGDDAGTDRGTGCGPLVSVFVDAVDAAPSHGRRGVVLEGGPRIGVQALEAILCEATVEVVATTTAGQLIDLGGGQVIPPRARRRALARDGGRCVIAGCRSGTGCKCITSFPAPRAAATTSPTWPLSAGTTTTSRYMAAGCSSTRTHRPSNGG